MLIQIQNLITALLEVPPSSNAVVLAPIFSKLNYTKLDFSTIPPQLEEHIRQLDTLNGLTRTSLLDESRLLTLNTQQAKLSKLKRDNAQLQQKIDALDAELKKDGEKLEVLFKQFSPKILAHLLKANPVDSKLPPLEAKKEQIKKYFEQLKNIHQEKEKLAAKVKLLQLKKQINLLRLELSSFNVSCTDDNAKDNFQSKIASLTLQNKSVDGIKNKLKELRDNIAQHISAETIATKIKDIEQRCTKIKEELDRKETAYDILVLDGDTKAALNELYINSPDREALIKQYTDQKSNIYETAKSFVFSLIAPQKPTENADKDILDRSTKYLQLRFAMDKLKSKLEQLASHTTHLQSLQPSKSNDLEQLKQSMDQAGAFCRANSSLIKPVNPSSSALDCYLTLVDNEVSIQQKPIALKTLQELQAVNKELNALRAKYELLESNDSQIPDETVLKEQETVLLNQIETAENLKQQLQLCAPFLNKCAERERATIKRNEDVSKHQEVEKTIGKTDSAALQNQIDQLTQKLITHQQAIDKTMTQIRGLTPLTQIVDNDATLPKTVDIGQPTVHAELNAGAKPSATLPDNKPISVVAIRQDSQIRPSPASTEPKPGTASESGLQTATPIKPPAIDTSDSAKDAASASTGPTPDTATKPGEGVPAPAPLQPPAQPSTDTAPASTEPDPSTASKPSEGVQPPATHSKDTAASTEPNSGTASKPGEGVPMPTPMQLSPRHSKDAIQGAALTLLMSGQDAIAKPTNVAVSDPTQSATTASGDTTTTTPRRRALSTIKEEREDDLIQKLYYLHHKNRDLLKTQAQDIQAWYNEVYDSITTYSAQAPSSLERPAHLLKDILFELEQRKNIDIIRAYMRLCPNPKEDLNNLLELKPDQPIMDAPFDERSDLKNVSLELKPLYDHYIKLKESHPVEAELLLQAIRILCQTKISIDSSHSNVSLTNTPSLSLDPRYESLKRHRGFLKVWEVLEDFFRMIIGKITGQAEHEYYKRPCFFNTTSAQLIEEADLNNQEGISNTSVL